MHLGRVSSPLFLVGALVAGPAIAESWQPVTGADNLRTLVSGNDFTATLVDGVTATARYEADGTGALNAWGKVWPRTWESFGEVRLPETCLN